MMKKKIENEINVIEIIRNILDSLGDILVISKPIFEKVSEIDEADKFYMNGRIVKIAYIFEDIIKQCEKLGAQRIPRSLLENLLN